MAVDGRGSGKGPLGMFMHSAQIGEGLFGCVEFQSLCDSTSTRALLCSSSHYVDESSSTYSSSVLPSRARTPFDDTSRSATAGGESRIGESRLDLAHRAIIAPSTRRLITDIDLDDIPPLLACPMLSSCRTAWILCSPSCTIVASTPAGPTQTTNLSDFVDHLATLCGDFWLRRSLKAVSQSR